MKRAARTGIIALVVAGFFYAGGGGNAIRRVRARWRAWLQPPTADQMQRAVPDTATPPSPALSRDAVRGRMWMADPPRPASVAVVLATIIVSALLTMYFTGRTGSSIEPR